MAAVGHSGRQQPATRELRQPRPGRAQGNASPDHSPKDSLFGGPTRRAAYDEIRHFDTIPPTGSGALSLNHRNGSERQPREGFGDSCLRDAADLFCGGCDLQIGRRRTVSFAALTRPDPVVQLGLSTGRSRAPLCG